MPKKRRDRVVKVYADPSLIAQFQELSDVKIYGMSPVIVSQMYRAIAAEEQKKQDPQ